MKDNTAFGRMENEISISDTKANIRNWNTKETAMGMNRKRNIDLEEARPVIGSGTDSNPAGNNCGEKKKERQALWKLIPIMMMLLNVASASATQSINLVPPKDYTVFQNDTPAIFYCYGNGFGNGALVGWTINGTGYNAEHAQRGITVITNPPTATNVSSRLMVSSNSSINNNTVVICKAIDITFSNVLTSQPANLTIQGTLDASTNFSVKISNTSNITFLLSWGAPFTLDVTDSPDIFYYTLCTNITIYGCRNISNPGCVFNGTSQCNSSVDFTDPSLNGTNGGQNKTIMDYGDPIIFTLTAVSGAGNGTPRFFEFRPQLRGDKLAPSQTEPRSMNVFPTTTTLTSNGKSEIQIGPLVGGLVSVVFILIALLILSSLVIAIKCFSTKRKPSVVAVELYSYATHQKEPTCIETNKNQIPETSHYMAVACHPIISIPAPHQKVLYSEVKPHNEKPTSGYVEVECHPIISIPAPHDEVQYSETITKGINHPRRVECDTEENENESVQKWCQNSNPAEKGTKTCIAPGIEPVRKQNDVSEGKQDNNRKLSESIEHPKRDSFDWFGMRPFEADYHSYNTSTHTQTQKMTCNGSPVFAFVSTMKPQFTELSPTVLVICEDGWSPVMCSSSEEHVKCVEVQLEMSAQVNQEGNTTEVDCNSDSPKIIKKKSQSLKLYSKAVYSKPLHTDQSSIKTIINWLWFYKRVSCASHCNFLQ